MCVCLCKYMCVCVCVLVLEAADSLCEELQSCGGQSSDLSPVLMRAVTNVICRLVFSSSYQPNDPELLKVMDYNVGIVQTIARGGLVDVFPWLRVCSVFTSILESSSVSHTVYLA